MAFTEACKPSPTPAQRSLERISPAVSRLTVLNDRLLMVTERIEGSAGCGPECDNYGGSYIGDINELDRQVDRLNNLVIGLEDHI